MTQTELLEGLGHVNSNSFRNFMSYHGRDQGRDNITFRGAVKFFYRHEKREKENKAVEKASQKAAASSKKRKTSEENLLNQLIEEGSSSSHEIPPKKTTKAMTSTSSSSNTNTGKKTKAEVHKLLAEIQTIQLTDSRVFDDCDEVRRKIGQFIQLEHVPMTRFAEAIIVNVQTINNFLSKKGPQEGAGSKVYRGSYYFFEKLRLLRKEPKSRHRIHSESKHPTGYPLENPRKYLKVFTGFRK